MKRAAIFMTVLAALALAASAAFAGDREREERFGDRHGDARIELARHDRYEHHDNYRYERHGYYGRPGYYGGPVVVYPRAYAYPPPVVVVPSYPPPPAVVYPAPAVIVPRPYYEYPRSFFEYRGRGLSFGIGL